MRSLSFFYLFTTLKTMNFPPESGSPLLEKPSSSFRFQLVYLCYVTCNDDVCMMIDVYVCVHVLYSSAWLETG